MGRATQDMPHTGRGHQQATCGHCRLPPASRFHPTCRAAHTVAPPQPVHSPHSNPRATPPPHTHTHPTPTLPPALSSSLYCIGFVLVWAGIYNPRPAAPPTSPNPHPQLHTRRPPPPPPPSPHLAWPVQQLGLAHQVQRQDGHGEEHVGRVAGRVAQPRVVDLALVPSLQRGQPGEGGSGGGRVRHACVCACVYVIVGVGWV